MKKYLIGVNLLSSMASLGAMNSQAPKAQEITVTDLVEQYMNTTVSALLLRLSAFFADKNDAHARTRKIVHECIDAIKFGLLPLAVKNNPQGKIEDFFDSEKIGLFFKKIWEHHEKKKLGARKFHVYIKHFRKTLKLDAIAKKLSKQEADSVDKFLKGAYDYYKNRNGIEIDSLINFDQLPSFLRELLSSYTNLDKLKILLNRMLTGAEITKEHILDTIKFKPFLKEFGCHEEKQELMENGLRGIVALMLEATQNDREAAEHFMRFMGNGYMSERAQLNQPRSAAQPSRAESSGSAPSAKPTVASSGTSALVIRK